VIHATFGGLHWRLIPCDSRAIGHVERALERFSVGPTAGAITVAIATAPLGAFGEELSVEGDESRVHLQRSDFTAQLGLSARTATIEYGGEIPSLHAALRVATSFFLARSGGFLAHAASLVSHGRAFLFPGPSGAGKTTIARLAGDRTVLSDEVSAVVPDGNGYRCHATPFFGDFEGPRPGVLDAPLARVCFPSHGVGASLEPLGILEAARRLLACIFCFGWIPALQRRLLEAALVFVRRVPCFDLRFTPDSSLWRAVHA